MTDIKEVQRRLAVLSDGGNGGYMARAHSSDDAFLSSLAEEGLLLRYDSMFGNRYYAATERGRSAGLVVAH